MPGCRWHGLPLPCHTCIKRDIPRLEAENKQRVKENSPLDKDGNLLLHDIENLKGIIA